mmetsp:Transcript_41097/g.66091  ORF Transcript_41097/g.66091 Transcript_41097/m.66091 type:complete len:116 (-) Transcript_41097:360-707(-)
MVIIQQTTYTPLFSRKMKANGNHKNKIEVQSQKGGKQTYLCVWRGGVLFQFISGSKGSRNLRSNSTPRKQHQSIYTVITCREHTHTQNKQTTGDQIQAHTAKTKRSRHIKTKEMK